MQLSIPGYNLTLRNASHLILSGVAILFVIIALGAPWVNISVGDVTVRCFCVCA